MKSLGSSPWGAIQHATEILPGIRSVSTASHGGIHVSRERLAQMPAYMRTTGYSSGGWFEEDVDWCLPFCVFEAEIRASGDAHSVNVLDDGAHLKTLRDWHPERYEKFYGVTLAPGESVGRDEETWKKEHAGDLQVVSAFGDWQNGVPAGMVGVVACVGGVRGSQERYFLVGKDEYHARGRFGFVIDVARHTETGDFTQLGSKPEGWEKQLPVLTWTEVTA